MYKVYIKVNENNLVTKINSEIFLSQEEMDSMVCIDEGVGVKYSHAQGNYFKESNMDNLYDDKGRNNYKYIDSKLVLLTEEEKDALFPEPEKQPTAEEEIATIKTQLEEQEKINTEILKQMIE